MFTLDSNLIDVVTAGAKFEEEENLGHGQTAKQRIGFLTKVWLSKFPEVVTVRDYLNLEREVKYTNGKLPHRNEALTRLLMLGFYSQQN